MKSIGSSKILFLFILPALVFLLLFFVYPLIRLVLLSFGEQEFTLDNYVRIISTPLYISVILNTIKLSIIVTAICLVIGFPVAYLLARLPENKASILFIFILIPFWTNLLVRTYAWMILLQSTGLINNFLEQIGILKQPISFMYNLIGVTIGMVYILLPFMIFPMYSVIKKIDNNLISASLNLGASPIQTFLKITLPLSKGGIGAGSLLVFILSMGFYITPTLMGGLNDITISMVIAQQVNAVGNWGFASALAMILFVLIVLMTIVYNYSFRIERIWGG
jgi:ABC-type spermidine/putrescine transport system permease subunit I